MKGSGRCSKYALAVLVFFYSGFVIFAQETPGSEKAKETEKNFRFSPFVAPAYTPELGLFVAGGGLLTFKTSPADEALKRSSVPFSLGVSTKEAVIFSTIMDTYWTPDRVRVSADIWYKDMPDNYWGVGYDAGRNTEKGEDTTAYRRIWWQVNPRVTVRIHENLFTGVNLDFNRTQAKELSPGVAADSAIQEYGLDNFNSGAGLILLYDSRDIPVNAYSGTYLSGTATFYGGFLGGDNTYRIFDFDYRQYLSVQRPGRTIAWQLSTRIGSGDVPWGELSQLGTPFDLRGYTWGQYRDKTMLFGIIEYRHKFLKNTPNAFGRYESRHGVVGWVGAGAVGRELDDFGNILPNAGVGYRYEVQPRMNLRIDVGFGVETLNFYVNFNEAF